MVLKQIALVSAILISSGCSLLTPKPREVEIITKPVQIKIVQPTLPRPLDLKEPYWYVVSEKNLDQFIKDVTAQAGTLVFTAMTIEDYELMAYNMQEIKRYVRELGQVVIYYKKVTTIEEPEEDGKQD
jgi:hypothetical protein|tara:strand:- start:287 stop:670 length:384 start_codon:yes stop_codon:yes gene_type:complete